MFNKKMLNKRKRYYKIKRLWETRARENESFPQFLLSLESDAIISFKEWFKFRKMFDKLG